MQLLEAGAHRYKCRYAWHRLFTLTRQFNKGLTAADTQGMAASVLLAALAIPRYDASETEGEAALHRERTARMAGILGYRDFQAPVRPGNGLHCVVCKHCCCVLCVHGVCHLLGLALMGSHAVCQLGCASTFTCCPAYGSAQVLPVSFCTKKP